MAPTPAEQHALYVAHRAAHRCTRCPAPAQQRRDGRWLTICRRCAVKAQQRHQQRYLRLQEAHRCVTCAQPAQPYGDGTYYVRCATHLADMTSRNRVVLAQKAQAQHEKGAA